ncbi:two component transcriptional regulator, winged helix family [Lunatimonas lonarensis]|uniref:Two component transcriptional regulator, winged helix family n=1 Tax=Lunatimonas lonarensis TaxID=1232681 RepID=R7ZM31_9BACT|nr:response regulator [Lunatimonas lonarensis]EON75158.1 two component transcriptional regulator, winged helix family [Lunatimonas lonarensis]
MESTLTSAKTNEKMGKNVILIVDDEKEILTMLSRFLKRRGYEVVTAATIAEGKACVKTSYPDIVFLDVNLPDGNGLQAVPDFMVLKPNLSIILMSAFSDSGIQAAAKERGASGFLSKPFSLESINQMLER